MRPGEIVLFIDELHTIVGAGCRAEGAVDARQLLKPMARARLSFAQSAPRRSTSTASIEKDAALERRFQPIFVGQPSVADTIAITRPREALRGASRVEIRDSALVAAAVLSDRYITDRFLPDKAIDLVDAGGLAICGWRSTRRPSSSTRQSRTGACGSSRSARGDDGTSPSVREPLERSARRCPGGSRRAGSAAGRAEGLAAARRRHQASDRRKAPHGGRAGGAGGQPRPRRRDPVRGPPGLEKSWPARAAHGDADGAGRGRPGTTPRTAVVAVVDEASRSRACSKARSQAMHPRGGAAAQAHVVGPGSGGQAVSERAPARTLEPAGPEPPDRLVYASSGRPASARPKASPARWRVQAVRRRARDGAARHVRIPGAAPRSPASSAPRRGTSATRGRAAQPRRCASRFSRSSPRDEVERGALPRSSTILLQLLDDGQLTDGQGRDGRLPQHW